MPAIPFFVFSSHRLAFIGKMMGPQGPFFSFQGTTAAAGILSLAPPTIQAPPETVKGPICE